MSTTPPLESGQNIELGAVTVETAEVPAPPSEPAAEPVVEAPPAPKPEDMAFASKFAALSRKEKQFRDERKAFEAERAQWKAEQAAREKEISTKFIDPAVLKDRRQALALLEKHGLPFKDLAEQVLNGGEPTADHLTSDLQKTFEQKFADLEKKLEEKEKRENDEKVQAGISQYRKDLNDFVTADKENYELINRQEAHDLVFEVVETHYKNTEKETGEGVLLSNKEAADAVEKFLLNEAKKLIDVKKLQPLMPQPPAPPKPPGQKAAPTLSNTQSTQVPPIGTKKLSDEESKREAAKLIKWND